LNIKHPFLPYLISNHSPCRSAKTGAITRCNYQFKLWYGKPLWDTYGGKAVLGFEGKPVFTELAIPRILQAAGWEGVWSIHIAKHFGNHGDGLQSSTRRLIAEVRDFRRELHEVIMDGRDYRLSSRANYSKYPRDGH
jgi:hypothetical protein